MSFGTTFIWKCFKFKSQESLFERRGICRTDIFPALFHLPFYLKILTIV